MIKKTITSHRKNYIRRVINGYKNLSKNGNLYKIAAIKRKITITKLNLRHFSPKILGEDVPDYELVVRQFLISKLLNSKFNQSILVSQADPNKKIVYPLPLAWQEIIEEHNFKVSRFRSTFLWFCFILYYYSLGVLYVIKKIYESFLLTFSSNTKLPENYVYFDNLTSSNLPKTNTSKHSYEIISWYSAWGGQVSGVENYYHNSNVPQKIIDGKFSLKNIPSPILSLNQYSKIYQFLMWGISSIFICLIDLLRGRCWHALLFHESSKANLVKCQSENALAREYLFHNSSWVYRPLWTYIAQQRGAKITFYFYSANIQDFHRNGESPDYYGYRAMNWPRYLVWDVGQSDYIKKIINNDAEIMIVGPIWFDNNNINSVPLNSSSIVIFDVQPVRNYYYYSLALDFDYYIPAVINQFLSDINEVFKNNDMDLVLKRKRNIGNLAHPKYQSCLKELTENNKNFHVFDPDVNIHNLIRNSTAVISIPFTSAALLANEFGKASVYYDPTSMIDKNDVASHSTRLISGIDELVQWRDSHFKTSLDGGLIVQ